MAIGIVTVIERALIGIGDGQQTTQVVIGHAGGHTGRALPTLCRFISNHHRCRLVEGVVLDLGLFGEGARASKHAAFGLGVAHIAQDIGQRVTPVAIGINRFHCNVQVIIATNLSEAIIHTGSVFPGERR